MAQQNVVNSHAITSLILGIISVLIPLIGLVSAIIGLILGRKSLQQIEQLQEDGRGLAISGIVCSIIGMIIQFFVVISILSFLSLTSYSEVI